MFPKIRPKSSTLKKSENSTNFPTILKFSYINFFSDMTHFQDSEEHTSMLILLFLFLTILILAVYSNIRLFVILCRNFPRERTHSYFPMLLLLNTLSSMTVIILVCSMLLPFVPHGVDGKIGEIGAPDTARVSLGEPVKCRALL